jgi:hypothetical protein
MAKGIIDYFVNGSQSHQRQVESEKQQLSDQKTSAILRGHTAAMQTASQYGLPGSQEWKQAYAATATQTGVPQPYIDQVLKLTADPRLSQITMAKMNEGRYGQPLVQMNQPNESPTGYGVSGNLGNIVLGQQASQATPQKPKMVPAGSSVPNMVAGNAATAKTPFANGSPVVQPAADAPAATQTPAAQPSAAKKSSWRDLISGIGKAFATANGMSGASGMAGSPAAVASMANPNLDVVTGKEIPEDAVRAGQTPTTMKDIGIESVDDAEQFQALEAMVGKSLPEGFDLRVDYGRDPEFYATLFKAIRDGVKDERNPGKRRKLSTQEIIATIMGE